jgi:hypothetical protein
MKKIIFEEEKSTQEGENMYFKKNEEHTFGR